MKKVSFAVIAVLILAGCSRETTQADQTNAQRNQANRSPEATQSARATNAPNENSDRGQAMKDAEYKFKLEGLETPKREGWVTLAALQGGQKTRVTIDLMDAPAATGTARKATASPNATGSAVATASAGMPAHIHAGSCPKPGEVKYPLTNVINGKSVTEVAATVDQMMALGALSVNVHKSAAELSKYVACGNLDFKTAKTDKEGTKSADMKSPKVSASPKASRTPAASATPRASATPTTAQ